MGKSPVLWEFADKQKDQMFIAKRFFSVSAEDAVCFCHLRGVYLFSD